MAKCNIEIEDAYACGAYAPDGFRNPRPGDVFVTERGSITQATNDVHIGPRLILRPKPPVYRDVTIDDIGKEVEVSDSLSHVGGNKWDTGKLMAILHSNYADTGVFVVNLPGDDQLASPWIYARIKVTE